MKTNSSHRQNGGFKVFVILTFWFLVWVCGPSLFTYAYTLRGLTVTYLAIAMLVLYLRSGADESFGEMVGNTSWVFPTIFMMAVVSTGMYNLNSMEPELLGKELFESTKNLLGFETEPYLVDSVFWGNLNYFYFGEYWTFGWQDAGWTYAIWCFPAFFISYWDWVRNHKKEIAIAGGVLLAANTLSKRNKKPT